MKKRIFSALLAFMIVLSMFACASAETAAPAINLLDMNITAGGVTYDLPITVSQLTEMGVNVPDLSSLGEGQYAPFVDVDDGSCTFSLRFEYNAAAPEDPIATGCMMDVEYYPGITVSGMTLGEITLGEVIDAMGPDRSGATNADSLTYYFRDINESWTLSFDGSDRNSKLTQVHTWTDIPALYGPVETIVVCEELPDPASMPLDQIILGGNLYQTGDTVQKLLDNGWKLPLSTSPETEIVARDGNKVSGGRYLLYNGESFVKVYAYNVQETPCALKDAVIDTILVEYSFDASIIAAGGIQPGVSTYEDAVAAFGEPSSSSEEYNFTKHTFRVLNGAVRYDVYVNADNAIVGLGITGLM